MRPVLHQVFWIRAILLQVNIAKPQREQAAAAWELTAQPTTKPASGRIVETAHG